MQRMDKQTMIALARAAGPLRDAPSRHDAYSMVFVIRASIGALATFVFALTGILVQWLLTASYMAESRSMITSVVELVATLLSVVIGLLIWTSYGQFNTQQSDVETLGCKACLRTTGPNCRRKKSRRARTFRGER